MSKDLVINGVTYNGVESMEIPNTEGEKVVFVPEDEAGVELPELTNPAAASDIVEGKQAIDADGNVVEGTIQDNTLLILKMVPESIDGGTFYAVTNGVSGDVVVRKKRSISLYADASAFGEAGTDQVLAGKTFTSKNGLKLTGMYTPPSYTEMLPSLENPSASAEVLADKEYIDADGNKATGTMPNNGSVQIIDVGPGQTVDIPEGYHDGEGYVKTTDLATLTPADCGPENIEVGYTAWVNGVQISGTHVCESGGSGVVCTITFCDQYGVGFDVALPGGILNVPSDGTPVTAEVPDGTTIVASQTSSMGALSHAGCLEYLGAMNANNEVVAYFVTSDYGTTGSIELVS